MIVLQILLLILGFVMLIKGADWFVDGSAGIAARFGIPQIVIGLTIVAMGTSMPEAAVSITAAAKGTADIAVGNVIGSNILNILIILGVTSVIVPVAVQKSTLYYEIPFMLLVTAVLMFLGQRDGRISRLDGAVLWGLFILYCIYLFFLSRSKQEEDVLKTSGCKLSRLILEIVVGGGVVVWGSNLAVDSASCIAREIGLGDRIIGLTIVALGTSLPEFVTSVTAARRGNADIAIGNIVGSNIFNVLFVLGTSALIIPLEYGKSFLADGIAAVVSIFLLWLAAFRTGKLGRIAGAVMLLTYAGYFVYLLAAE